MSDGRAVAARQYHDQADRSERDAGKFRKLRDNLIRELKNDGWNNHQLAAAIGCTEGNIRHILKGDASERPTTRPRRDRG